MVNDQLFHEYLELISLTKTYLQDTRANVRSVVSNEATYAYFKELYTAKRQRQATTQAIEKEVEEPIPTAPSTATKEVVQKLITATQEQAKAVPSIVKPETKQVETIKATTSLTKSAALSFPFLPREFQKKEAPNFITLQAQVQKLAPQLIIHAAPPADSIAIEKVNSWRDSYPKIAIISFLETNSPDEQFLQNIVQAVNSRLTTCQIVSWHIAECVTLAQCNHLQALIIVGNQSTATKVNEFTLPLHFEQPEEQPYAPLQLLGRIYKTPVASLLLQDSFRENEEKAKLWKALRTLAQ